MPLNPGTAQVAGSAIGAVTSLIGGRRNRKESRRIRRQQQAQFDAMMDQTVQRRVKDAEAAGIHPLAALGISPSTGPTITGVGAGAEGDAIARAGEAAGRGLANAALAKAQVRNIDSQTALNEANRQLALSEAARRSGLSPGTDGGARKTPDVTNPVGTGQYVEPEIPKSTAPGSGVTAGEARPTMTDHKMPDGQIVRNYAEGMELDELKQVSHVGSRARWAYHWKRIELMGPDSAAWLNSRDYIYRNSDPRDRARINERIRRTSTGGVARFQKKVRAKLKPAPRFRTEGGF
jgi:hypothetical protein